MLLSPIDKVFEFGDSIFYNTVINKENFEEDPLIMRIIRKGNFAVLIMNQADADKFQLIDEIAEKFKFKLIKKLKFPKINWSKYKKNNSKGQQDLKSASEPQKTEIQKAITVEEDDTKISLDYILFWLSSEDLKMIENQINNHLLSEVNAIQHQSNNLKKISKAEFIQKMDTFENHYIGAVYAKDSKAKYFEQIIGSNLASLEFRYLIRHLMSRMTNLNNTNFIIERKLLLARNTFQMTIDTNLTEASENVDKLMRKFSLISIIFLPLTVLTGMWGMN